MSVKIKKGNKKLKLVVKQNGIGLQTEGDEAAAFVTADPTKKEVGAEVKFKFK